jgi:hypothetical protein
MRIPSRSGITRASDSTPLGVFFEEPGIKHTLDFLQEQLLDVGVGLRKRAAVEVGEVRFEAGGQRVFLD